ncbi:hypothetical protein QL285_064384 [Trifolium repens]|nr:hypothetical protein QL285_064384 [Trifolium repens]
MAARSSTVIVQEPFNPVLPPIIDLKAQGKLVYKDNETDAGPDAFDFNTEKFVDFESLKANGIDVQSLFFDQQWKNYFEMLNGFVYYDIVKYFWQKATVFDRACADEEVRKIVAKNKSLQGKTRHQLGLKPYRGKEIRSNILGINILITQEHIAKMLGLDNKGEDVDMYDEKSKHLEAINQDLFMPGCSNRDFGKLKFMKHQFGFAFRVFLASIVTREGGLDTISIQHRHFIWFLYKKVKINLAKTLFEHLCLTITKSRAKSPSNIHHPRLISELIRQTKLTDILSAREKLRVFNTAKYDANVLVNMKKKTKDEIIKVKTPLQAIYEKYFWCDGFPTISEYDNEEVIKNFLEIVRRETGVRMPRKFVVSVPNWDIFKGPKEITRSRKQPRTTEQDIVEEGSQDQEKVDDDETEQGDSGAGGMAAEGKDVAAQKEKRTKKRSDRPVNAEEDQPVRATKRTKTVMKRKAADTLQEEVAYLRFVEAEQARIAAEVESKRLADEEALKLLVDQAVHIAEDIEMPDQNQVGEASDKGKTPIIDTTPPASPKFEPGSPSTPIPPAVQSALDNIKSELAEDIKDEIDVLRIDLRSDLTSAIAASEEATHRRMDTMMQTLLKAISDIKKP